MCRKLLIVVLIALPVLSHRIAAAAPVLLNDGASHVFSRGEPYEVTSRHSETRHSITGGTVGSTIRQIPGDAP
jgi:hypothetical protein